MTEATIQHQGVLTQAQKLAYLRQLEANISQNKLSISNAKKLFLLGEELLEIFKTDYEFNGQVAECNILLRPEKAKMALKFPIYDGSEKFVQRIKQIVAKRDEKFENYRKIWLRNCIEYHNRHLMADYPPLHEILFHLRWMRLVQTVCNDISYELIPSNTISSFFVVKMRLIYA